MQMLTCLSQGQVDNFTSKILNKNKTLDGFFLFFSLFFFFFGRTRPLLEVGHLLVCNNSVLVLETCFEFLFWFLLLLNKLWWVAYHVMQSILKKNTREKSQDPLDRFYSSTCSMKLSRK
ncbi:hypothetical protein PanWU01x14_106010, partial [Parasponia andersonii]